MREYTKESLEADINWLCEQSNHPFSTEEAEKFIKYLLECEWKDD